ncbi:GntR family transcriptional regulator [Mycolicibacterium sp. XJ879]
MSGTTSKPRPTTRVEDAVEILREEIVTGKLPPGSPLRLKALADRLGMSMMPVRGALLSLESLGLVEQDPRRGARVGSFSLDDLYNTYEARLALEVLAVERAAARFTEEDEEKARKALAEHTAAAANTMASREAHTALHFAIYEAAQSPWLMKLIMPLWVNSERYRLVSIPHRGDREVRRLEHERIIDACARRNPRVAARELSTHLAYTANLVARELGGEDMF